MIVPTLRVVTPPSTLRVHQKMFSAVGICDAERHGRHSHAEHGNDQTAGQNITLTSRLAVFWSVSKSLVFSIPYLFFQ
ncbi:MAG: hypothetical protein JWQ69_3490 [Pseudomonas sp.]|nr:hypothetical protein [Pseudomonas sp.]